MLVWSRIAAADETTALLIRATLRALAGPDAFGEAEVIAIPDATLAQWQRPASDPPASEWRDVDGNDRRWLWGAVLVLLVVEQVAAPPRASRRSAAGSAGWEGVRTCGLIRVRRGCRGLRAPSAGADAGAERRRAPM